MPDLSALKSTETQDIIPLVVIIILILILIIGVIGQYFDFSKCCESFIYDDDDDNLGLAELNRKYRIEDDLEYQAHLNDDHNSWESSIEANNTSPSSSGLLLHDSTDIQTLKKQSSQIIADKRKELVRPSPSFFRSKSYSFRAKKVRNFWDDRLAKLNTPQVI